MQPEVLRILDANFNRAREALRVIEEYARFALDEAPLVARLKGMRHALADMSRCLCPPEALACRDTPGDVGTGLSTISETTRVDAEDVVTASFKRLSESLRAIEEYGKIIDSEAAVIVERLRYDSYALEQELLLKAPRRQRLWRARLHVLLTAELCDGDWQAVCRDVMEGGADVIQLREKRLADAAILDRARRLREMTQAAGALLIINDRADIARLAGADGVHLGQQDMGVADARAIAGPGILIDKSIHSAEEFRAAVTERPDYVAVGPMFESPTKPVLRAAGPQLLKDACAVTELPLVAIGGIDAENVRRLEAPRGFAVAVCHAVIASRKPRREARRLKDALEKIPREVRPVSGKLII